MLKIKNGVSWTDQSSFAQKVAFWFRLFLKVLGLYHEQKQVSNKQPSQIQGLNLCCTVLPVLTGELPGCQDSLDGLIIF